MEETDVGRLGEELRRDPRDRDAWEEFLRFHERLGRLPEGLVALGALVDRVRGDPDVEHGWAEMLRSFDWVVGEPAPRHDSARSRVALSADGMRLVAWRAGELHDLRGPDLAERRCRRAPEGECRGIHLLPDGTVRLLLSRIVREQEELRLVELGEDGAERERWCHREPRPLHRAATDLAYVLRARGGSAAVLDLEGDLTELEIPEGLDVVADVGFDPDGAWAFLALNPSYWDAHGPSSGGYFFDLSDGAVRESARLERNWGDRVFLGPDGVLAAGGSLPSGPREERNRSKGIRFLGAADLLAGPPGQRVYGPYLEGPNYWWASWGRPGRLVTLGDALLERWVPSGEILVALSGEAWEGLAAASGSPRVALEGEGHVDLLDLDTRELLLDPHVPRSRLVEADWDDRGETLLTLDELGVLRRYRADDLSFMDARAVWPSPVRLASRADLDVCWDNLYTDGVLPGGELAFQHRFPGYANEGWSLRDVDAARRRLLLTTLRGRVRLFDGGREEDRWREAVPGRDVQVARLSPDGLSAYVYTESNGRLVRLNCFDGSELAGWLLPRPTGEQDPAARVHLQFDGDEPLLCLRGAAYRLALTGGEYEVLHPPELGAVQVLVHPGRRLVARVMPGALLEVLDLGDPEGAPRLRVDVDLDEGHQVLFDREGRHLFWTSGAGLRRAAIR